MEATIQTSPISKGKLWTARIMSGIAVLFLVFDCAIKLIKESHAVEGTVQLGYPESSVVIIGIIETICLALYVTPRTSILGAILMTGYLGGAIATHVRLENPLFSHVLFPIYIAILLWGGLYLHDRQLQALVPFRKGKTA